jgi:hypothetical protein
MEKTKLSYINLNLNFKPFRVATSKKIHYSGFSPDTTENSRVNTPSSAQRFFRSVKLINSKKIEKELAYKLPKVKFDKEDSKLIRMPSPKSEYSKRLHVFNQTFIHSDILFNKARFFYFKAKK